MIDIAVVLLILMLVSVAVILVLALEDKTTEGNSNTTLVAYGIGIGNGPMIYSKNGTQWLKSAMVDNSTFPTGNVVRYGNNTWLAAGQKLLRSRDGIRWEESTDTTTAPFGTWSGWSLHYANDRWFVGGRVQSDDPDGSLLYSDNNGFSWNVPGMKDGTSAPFYKGVVYSIYYGDNRWYAAGEGISSGHTLLYSEDNGISWNLSYMTDGTTAPFGSKGEATGVFYGNNLWVATGLKDTNATGENILYSTNGISWASADIYSDTELFTLYGYDVFYNDTWVAIGISRGPNLNFSSNIIYSTNGISWYPSAMSDGSSFFDGLEGRATSLVYDTFLRKWLCVGDTAEENNYIIESSNGISWKKSLNTGISIPHNLYSIDTVNR